MVKWSGKNEFWSGKSQGISFQTKSGHPVLPKCLSCSIMVIITIMSYCPLLTKKKYIFSSPEPKAHW